YNPNARVVTLGGGGYNQDQEYLALHAFLALRLRHADLVVDWASIADDVPGNTFRSGQPRPGQTRPKPTFALRGGDSAGPTEGLGAPVYKTKISTLSWPLFIDLDRNWATLLPKPDPGAASPPPGAETLSHVHEPLEQQRTPMVDLDVPEARPGQLRHRFDPRAVSAHAAAFDAAGRSLRRADDAGPTWASDGRSDRAGARRTLVPRRSRDAGRRDHRSHRRLRYHDTGGP